MSMLDRDWYHSTFRAARGFTACGDGGLIDYRYLIYAIVFLPLLIAALCPDCFAQQISMSQGTALGVACGAAALHLLAAWLLFGPGERGSLQLLKPFCFTALVGMAFLFFVQYVAADSRGVGHPLLNLIFRFVAFSYHLVDSSSDALGQLIGYTLGVGLWEESIKAIPVLYLLRRDTPSTWRSPCLVGLASGIGFGAAEGIHYAILYYNGDASFEDAAGAPLIVYAVRFASCIGLHAVFSAAGALRLFRRDVATESGLPRILWQALLALAPFIFLHGLYDVACAQDWPWVGLIAIGSAFVWLACLIQRD